MLIGRGVFSQCEKRKKREDERLGEAAKKDGSVRGGSLSLSRISNSTPTFNSLIMAPKSSIDQRDEDGKLLSHFVV